MCDSLGSIRIDKFFWTALTADETMKLVFKTSSGDGNTAKGFQLKVERKLIYYCNLSDIRFIKKYCLRKTITKKLNNIYKVVLCNSLSILSKSHVVYKINPMKDRELSNPFYKLKVQ